MLDLRLYMLQRITALVMIPLVVGHIAVMIYAVQGGLTASEILSRTQGSILWGAFYGTFVAAVSIHAAIGLRTIGHEWFGIRKGLDTITYAIGVFLLVLGLRAVFAVVA